MPPFRELYNKHNPTSGDHVLKLLGDHAHRGNGDHRAAVLTDLRAIRKQIKRRRAHDPRGILLEEDADGAFVARAPQSVIEVWAQRRVLPF